MSCTYKLMRGYRFTTRDLEEMARVEGWQLWQPDDCDAVHMEDQTEMLVETFDGSVTFKRAKGSSHWTELVNETGEAAVNTILGYLEEVHIPFVHDNEKCGGLQ